MYRHPDSPFWYSDVRVGGVRVRKSTKCRDREATIPTRDQRSILDAFGISKPDAKERIA